MNMKPDAAKKRRELAFELRSRGLTFKEIGKALGVCSQRACEIFSEQERLIERGPVEPYWTDGLSTRCKNSLFNKGIWTEEEAREAIRTMKLHPGRCYGYGWKSHRELCAKLGIEV